MRRWLKLVLSVVVILIVFAGVGAGWLVYKVGPIGAGYVAKYICSSTFISNRNPETVFKEDVAPVNALFKLTGFDVDRQKKSVKATFLGVISLDAIFREGCGCSLVVGTTEEAMRNQKFVAPGFKANRPRHAADMDWPQGSRGSFGGPIQGLDREKLEKAMDAAFSEPDPENPRFTRAVVVVHDGKLIAERYAPGFDRDMPLLGWSMSKSVTNALVGILVKEGKLSIMQPAPVPEWRGKDDPRGQITLDQLLRMSSGLAFEEVYGPLADATDMLYGSSDFAAFAADKPLETEPDGKWYYSSGTANIVARIVRQTAEKDYDRYYDFLYEKLFDKIGMYSALVEPDSSGTFVGSSYAFATPRDWARFGQLYLQDGIWEGERILPEGWVTYTTTPTPGSEKGEYGALFWLNAGNKDNLENRRWPRVSRDAYAAIGFQEQRVIVIPSKKLVLVRFGATSHRPSWNTDEFIVNVLAAFDS